MHPTRSLRKIRRIVLSAQALLWARVSPRVIPVGYYRVSNFGDLLTPDIIRHFRLIPLHCPKFEWAQAIGVGSILHMVKSDFNGAIIGSGLISEERKRAFPNAHTMLVRGKMTRDLCRMHRSTPLGDPGLIADQVYEKFISKHKKWKLGIVPHYSDVIDSNFELFNKWESVGTRIIDVRNPPGFVTREISACDFIVSSSLHGLVVADSLGIPNTWVSISGRLIGDRFKFDDYYSAFEMHTNPLELHRFDNIESLIQYTNIASKARTDRVKSNILEVFSKLYQSRLHI